MDIAAAESLFGLTDRELWVVTSHDGTQRGGMIATFVCQASLVSDLPRVLVAISKQHYTWGLVDRSDAFMLHLISEDQLDLVWRFGLQSGRHVDKLAGLRLVFGKNGDPRLADALGWLDCRVETQLESGDRTIFLAEVVEACKQRDGRPLTMRRMLELAPPDKLALLKQQREADSRVDADAIRAWRALTLGRGF